MHAIKLEEARILGFKRRIGSLLNPVKVAKNIKWRYGAGVSNAPHVFVVGAPRSGTTLMFKILASHPELSSIDLETFFFVPRDVFKSASYHRLEKHGGLTTNDMKVLIDSSRDLTSLYDRMVEKLLARDGGSRFLEKTPFHVLHLEYLARHFVNAKFINMIRDGRDGYVSNKRLTAGATLDQSVYEYSSLWKRSIVARRKLGNHSRILDVKYEDLTSNPSLWAKKIMDFLDEEFFEYQIRLGSSSGSKMFSGESGHERLSQPIAPTSVGQWRKSLTQEEIEGFHSTAGTMLEAMGYNLH